MSKRSTAKRFVLVDPDGSIICGYDRQQTAEFIRESRRNGRTLHVTHYCDSRRSYSHDSEFGFYTVRPARRGEL